jgi:hypothetical protein
VKYVLMIFKILADVLQYYISVNNEVILKFLKVIESCVLALS